MCVVDGCLFLCRNKGEDEMVEYFQNKYSGESVARILGDGEDMSDEITQQGLLPGVKWARYFFFRKLKWASYWSAFAIFTAGYSTADVHNVHRQRRLSCVFRVNRMCSGRCYDEWMVRWWLMCAEIPTCGWSSVVWVRRRRRQSLWWESSLRTSSLTRYSTTVTHACFLWCWWLIYIYKVK